MTTVSNTDRMERRARWSIVLVLLALTAGRGLACTLHPGDVLLTDLGKQAVIALDAQAGHACVVSAGGLLALPTGIAVNAAGQILVADAEAFGGKCGIIRIDPSSGAQLAVSQDGYFVDPQSIAVARRMAPTP